MPVWDLSPVSNPSTSVSHQWLCHLDLLLTMLCGHILHHWLVKLDTRGGLRWHRIQKFHTERCHTTARSFSQVKYLKRKKKKLATKFWNFGNMKKNKIKKKGLDHRCLDTDIVFLSIWGTEAWGFSLSCMSIPSSATPQALRQQFCSHKRLDVLLHVWHVSAIKSICW